MAFDYLASGRTDEYWYDMVGINDLKVIGRLNGVTGGQITWDYDSDLKVSGRLDVADAKFVNNCLIRVWLGSRMPTDKKTTWVELCTCFASTEQGHYENGKYSGTIQLRGVLARFADDVLECDYTHAKGASVLGRYRSMFRWLGGKYTWEGLEDTTFSKTKVFEFGSSAMEPMQHIADCVGGQLTCDTHGYVVLKNYVSPSKRPCVYRVKADGTSVTLAGVDESYTLAGTTNRYAVRHRYNWKYEDSEGKTKTIERTIYGLAESKSTWSTAYQKVGRYVTETWDRDTISTKIADNTSTAVRDASEAIAKKELNELAARWLNTAATTYRYYTFRTCTYLPFMIGDVIGFQYDKINVEGIVTRIDYDLKPGCPMTVEIRKVR